jgi:DNA-binding transcriptional ArsR family regulator
MKTTKGTSLKANRPDQWSALASPLRLEILGLFTSREPLAIADMAAIMGRSAGSLYHHVGILEKAGLLRRTGTRPKGKRHEALFLPAAGRIEFDARSGGEAAVKLAVKTMTASFRMAERDLEAALEHPETATEGPGRNLMATRMHLRASPGFLAKINKHLSAIEKLLADEAARNPRPSVEDQHLSLTLALLPLKGRGGSDSAKGR